MYSVYLYCSPKKDTPYIKWILLKIVYFRLKHHTLKVLPFSGANTLKATVPWIAVLKICILFFTCCMDWNLQYKAVTLLGFESPWVSKNILGHRFMLIGTPNKKIYTFCVCFYSILLVLIEFTWSNKHLIWFHAHACKAGEMHGFSRPHGTHTYKRSHSLVQFWRLESLPCFVLRHGVTKKLLSSVNVLIKPKLFSSRRVSLQTVSFNEFLYMFDKKSKFIF